MGLQPGGGVDDIAHDSHPIGLGLELYERLPGGDCRTDGEYQIRLFLVELLNRFLNSQRGSNGSFGIIFVSDRRTEYGEDAVAQELLHSTAEALDVFSAPAVIGGQPNANVFGIRGGGVGGEIDQICEQHGDDPPFFASPKRRTCRFLRLLGGTTRRAEPRPVRQLRSARDTDRSQ